MLKNFYKKILFSLYMFITFFHKTLSLWNSHMWGGYIMFPIKIFYIKINLWRTCNDNIIGRGVSSNCFPMDNSLIVMFRCSVETKISVLVIEHSRKSSNLLYCISERFDRTKMHILLFLNTAQIKIFLNKTYSTQGYFYYI